MSGPVPLPEFVTVAELARAARVSKMTIYRMIHAGELTAVLIRQSFRIPREDALALLKGRTQ